MLACCFRSLMWSAIYEDHRAFCPQCIIGIMSAVELFLCTIAKSFFFLTEQDVPKPNLLILSPFKRERTLKFTRLFIDQIPVLPKTA